VPTLHPQLPAFYRRRVEALEESLRDPATAAAAAEALRSLIDSILIHPGAKRGELTVSLRGDLAAFLHLAEAPAGGLLKQATSNTKTAVLLVGDGRSIFGQGVLGSLDAGTGFEPVTFRL
jgi:site-specific DNA recombinase